MLWPFSIFRYLFIKFIITDETIKLKHFSDNRKKVTIKILKTAKKTQVNKNKKIRLKKKSKKNILRKRDIVI